MERGRIETGGCRTGVHQTKWRNLGAEPTSACAQSECAIADHKTCKWLIMLWG